MNKIIAIIGFAIICLAYSNCSAKNGDTINPVIKSRVLLVENDTALITNAWNCQINPSGGLVLISDYQQFKSFLYNSLTGELIKVFTAEPDLTDSLKQYYKSRFLIDLVMSRKQLDSLAGKSSMPNMMTQMASNTVNNAIFVSDSLIFLAMYLRGISKIGKEKYQGMTMVGADFYEINNLNSIKHQKLSIADLPNYNIIATVIAYDQYLNKVLLNCSNELDGNNSEAWAVTSMPIDNYTDKPISISSQGIALLPQKAISSNLGYRFMTPRITSNHRGEIAIGYSSILEIYLPNKKSSFRLQKLPSDNESLFSQVKSNPSISGSQLIAYQNINVANIEFTLQNTLMVFPCLIGTDSTITP